MPEFTGTPDGDDLHGTNEPDVITAGGGDDNIHGHGGDDELYGEGGNDFIAGGEGDDLIDGGDDRDIANYAEALDSVAVDLAAGTASGADGNDTLVSIEDILGSNYNDLLIGDDNANMIIGNGGNDDIYGAGGDDNLIGQAGDDFLYGDFGNDHLLGGDGDDYMIGGDGADTANYHAATGSVFVDLDAGTATGADGNDTLFNIENILGSDGFGDVLSGDDNDNHIDGVGGNDTIRGFDGSDTLDGGDGADFLNGGLGDDYIYGGEGQDRAAYYTANALLGGVTVSLQLQGQWQDVGGQGSDLLTGIENVSGTAFADTLTGDDNDNWLWGSPATISPGNVSAANNDTLDGAGGNDLLTVGIGNHTLIGGSGIDTVRFTENGSPEANLTIFLGMQGIAQDTGNGSWTLTGIENLSGGLADDSFNGNFANNTLAGDLGSDVLNGGNGDDLLLGDGRINVDANGVITTFLDAGAAGGSDVLSGGNGNDTLYGGAANDSLSGGNNNDSLYAGDGNDFLSGGLGDDLIDGGAGFDRASFFHSTPSAGGVTVSLLLQGTAQNTGLTGLDMLIGIEQVSGTPYNDTLTGDDNDNWLWGSGAIVGGILSTTNNDIIAAGGGNDLITVATGDHQLSGGDGIDTVSFLEPENIALAVTISLALQGAPQDTGRGNWTLDGIENLSGNTGNDNLSGDGNANVLAGSLGDDVLSGAAGNDTLYGDGEFGIDNQGPGTGPVTVWDDAAFRYVAGVGGNDTLEGGDGDDQLYGGGGSDTASYASAGGGVQVFLYEAGFGEGFGAAGYDLLNGIENLTGSAFGDILWGDEQDNVLAGGGGQDELRGWDGNDTILAGDGDDFIVGGFGDDVLNGGDGYDRAGYFAQATSGVTVDLSIAGPQDTGLGFDTLIDIENVSGTIHGDTLTGNDGDNWLWGSTAGVGSTTNNDTLSGGGGNDLLTVGYGDHLLDGGTGTDTLRYTENGGAENGLTLSLALQGAAQASGAGSWTLSGFENLSGGLAADLLTGDGNANVLAGDSGNDTLVGGGGNDTLYGDGRVATLTGASGPITTHVDVAALGWASGDDLLEGGLGNDTLDGGGGIDTATYANASGGVTVDLGFGAASGADGDDTLANIENAIGSGFNDFLLGSGGANSLDGGDGHDLLRGFGGNDILLAGGGDDYLDGGQGDDLIDGGAGFDRVSYFSAPGPVTVDLRLQGSAQNTGYGMDTLIGIEHFGGTVFGDTLTGDDNANYIRGSTTGGFADTIDGQGGNDLIEDGAGDHILAGGAGTDTFLFVGLVGGPGITVSLALQGAAQNTGNGMMTLSGFENLSGSGTADTLTGDGGDNILAGEGNADVLSGGAGNDQLYGDGYVNLDTHGTLLSGPITLFTDLGAVGGDDLLEGGLGNDLLNGGAGTDTATYAHASGGVIVNLNAGTSSGADGNDTLSSIENLTGSEFNDNLTGNSGANVIDGLGGNDTLQGHAGDDTIYGGDGNDTINGDLGELNTSVSGNDTIYGGNGNDTIRSGLGNDAMFGGANNDLMRGGGGVDSFDGGSDDGEGFNGIGDRISFFEQLATQGVVADLRTGIISNDGFGNAETMTGIESLGGDTAYVDTFYGNDGRNYLSVSRGDSVYGFGDNDVLQVAAAAAVVDGGSGIDRLLLISSGGWMTPDSNGDGLGESMGAAAAGWTVNLTAGTMLDGYGYSGTVTGIENIDGSHLGDTLTGDSGVNILNGFDGDDTLDGRGGNDTLDGGNGVDSATYANASGGVDVDLRFGVASGADGDDTLLNIENVTGSGFNDFLIGDGGGNVLAGGGGHDVVRGGGGNDSVLGGDGNDILKGEAGDDLIDGGAGLDRAGYWQPDALLGGVTVSLLLQGVAQNTGSQGWDTLIGIEHVFGTPFADTLTGDGGDNWLSGSEATLSVGNVSATNNDQIDGGAGNDLLSVGIGSHSIIGGSGSDTLWFSENGFPETAVTVSLALQGGAQATGNGSWTLSGIENLTGGVASDTLTGDGNVNILGGGAGNDTLNGGGGNDTLYGDGGIAVDGNGVITTFIDVGTIAGGGIGADVAMRPGVSGNDTLDGGLGDDLINGGGGSDTASYASAGGSVTVDLDLQTASGANGNDTLVSIENATGSAFNDTLSGDVNANTLNGSGGNDRILGNGGNDIIDGGSGADYITGGNGNDAIAGGTGNDRVGYYQTNAALGGATVSLLTLIAQNVGSQGMDTLSGVEHVSGTPFADNLTGDGGDNWLWGAAATIAVGNVSATNNDTLSGGGGNDLLTVGIGNHNLSGGTGTDTVRFTENGTVADAALTVTLMTQGRAQNTGNGSWTLTSIENLSGGTAADKLTGDDLNNVIAGDLGNDTLIGNDGVDVLIGDGFINVDGNFVITRTYDQAGGGNDSLNGGKGDDFLYGGGGDDVMVGGQGIDRYVIEANSGDDRLADFALGVDKIVFNIPGGPDDFGDLVITKVGANVLISWGTTDSILIEGYRPSQITAASFEFGAPALAAMPALETKSMTVDPGVDTSVDSGFRSDFGGGFAFGFDSGFGGGFPGHYFEPELAHRGDYLLS